MPAKGLSLLKQQRVDRHDLKVSVALSIDCNGVRPNITVMNTAA